MAKKAAKSKSKPKTKKKPVKAKAAKRPAKKKAPAKASAAKPKAKAIKAAPKKKKKEEGLPPDKQIVGGSLIGLIEDFFGHVGVIAFKLEKPLSVGDTIRVKGHTTDITQKVESMQIDRQPVQTASPGDAVGVKIVDKARKGDAVYKI